MVNNQDLALGAGDDQTRSAWTSPPPAARSSSGTTPITSSPSSRSPEPKRVKWVEQNAAALDIELTPGDLAALEPLAARVVGARY